MTIRINKEKVLETKSIYKAVVLRLANLADKEPIEAKLDEDEGYFNLSQPFQGITRIKEDFVIAQL